MKAARKQKNSRMFSATLSNRVRGCRVRVGKRWVEMRVVGRRMFVFGGDESRKVRP